MVHEVSRPTALIICHEIWGLTPALRRKAHDWGERGFEVYTPSFYSAVGLPEFLPEPDRAFEARAALSLESIAGTLDSAVRAARHSAGIEVAVLGYSMGGTIALWAATSSMQISSAASYYGGGLSRSPWPEMPRGLDLLNDAHHPWLGIYGGRDPLTPAQDLTDAREACGRNSAMTRMHVYRELDHAFALDDADPRYCAPSTTDSERRVLAHLTHDAGRD